MNKYNSPKNTNSKMIDNLVDLIMSFPAPIGLKFVAAINIGGEPRITN